MSKADELKKIIEPIVESMGFEVVDVQYFSESGRWILRVFADSLERPGKITLLDCEKLSILISDSLDKNETLSTSYCLEVSSPGVDRVLSKEKDFLRFTGKKAKVTTYAPLAEGQRNFTGTLAEFKNDTLTLILEDGKSISISAKQIAKARLAPEI